MSSGNHQSRSNSIILTTRLSGIRGTPLRLAFGFVSGSPITWFLGFIGLPFTGLMGAVFVDPRLAGITVGLCGLFLLVFWWTSYRYLAPQVTINPIRRSLRIDHGKTPAWTGIKTVDLEELAGAISIPFRDHAMVRLEYQKHSFFRPRDFVVARSDVSLIEEALTVSGIPVTSPDDRVQTSMLFIRIVLTPLVLIAIPVYLIREYGLLVLWSDLGIITGIIVVWTFVAHLSMVVGLRPNRNSLALLVDVGGTILVLVGMGWLYLETPWCVWWNIGC